jgi:uncharacterized protein (DUF2147 family)
MKQLLLMGCLWSIHLFPQTPPPAEAILGEWLSPARNSRIRIFRQADTFRGKLVWGTGGPAKDEKNPNPALRNQEVIGLIILDGFVYKEGIWQQGSIYDPREGKTYACKLSLPSPDQLNIRGFIGISLFGRTEIWTKVNQP